MKYLRHDCSSHHATFRLMRKTGEYRRVHDAYDRRRTSDVEYNRRVEHAVLSTHDEEQDTMRRIDEVQDNKKIDIKYVLKLCEVDC